MHSPAPDLEAAIHAAAGGAPKALIIDLTEVDFLASAGMGLLVAAQDVLPPSVRLAVVAEGPATSRPLTLIGIAEIIDMYATLDAALSDVGP